MIEDRSSYAQLGTVGRHIWVPAKVKMASREWRDPGPGSGSDSGMDVFDLSDTVVHAPCAPRRPIFRFHLCSSLLLLLLRPVDPAA